MKTKSHLQKFTVHVLVPVILIVLVIWHFAGAVQASPSGYVVATGNTVVPRFDHTATLLPNGKVLIAGGMERNGIFLSSAEVYDPATGQFTSTGSMRDIRGFGSSAVLLPNGKVLVAGGWNGSSCNRSAEFYDPSTGVFTPAGNLTAPRCAAAALLLQDRKVLIIGGDQSADDNPAISAEVYDPSQGSFSTAGSMHGRFSTAVLLQSGKVLVLGNVSSAVYGPATANFSPSGNLTTERLKIGKALLPDGKVLIAGGQTGGPWGTQLSTTELYDPTTGRFTFGPEMHFKRFKLPMGVVPIRNGRILIAGGAEQPEVYDPASNSFLVAAGSKLDGFCFSTATMLANGNVLLVGGYSRGGGGAVSHAWLYKY